MGASENNFNQLVNSVNNPFINFNCNKTLEKHKSKVSSLIELSSGNIASGSYDCTIIIWNINTYKDINIIKEEGTVFCLLEMEHNKI